ncbi:MAG: hypothetical protein ABI425_01175 [Patescibacteria group bacterium]
MQPHSMSALAVANYVFAFGFGQKLPPRGAQVEIEYKTPDGKTKAIYHTISQIEGVGAIPYISLVKVGVRTTYGELCTVTVRRKSTGLFKSGEELIATHSVQHVAGLEEHYYPDRKKVSGFHRNSYRYRNFGGDVVYEGAFSLYCEVRIDDTNTFVTMPYKVKFKPFG